MNKSQYGKQKIKNALRHPIWLSSAIATLILPVFIPIASIESDAAQNKKSPEAARVRKVNGDVLISMNGSNRSLPLNPLGRTPQGIQAELRRWGDKLAVAGDRKSWATFEGLPSGPQISPKPQPALTVYEFPCKGVVGGLVVGWQKGKNRGCAPPGFEVRLSSRNGQVQLPSDRTIHATKNLLKAQTTRNQLLYCTVAATGKGWWFRWGTSDNSYNPCEEATQQCLRSISDGECQVVSLGEWSAEEPDLVVSVECADNRVFTANGNGWDVANELVMRTTNEALNNKAQSCALNVYQPDKLIIAPASEIATLIQAQDLNDALAIDALAGDVIIRSAKHPDGRLLKVGNRYVYPEDSIQALDVTEIAQSPALQEFLNPTNWSPDTTIQIKNYQVALGKREDRTKFRAERLLPILWSIWNIVQPPPERPDNNPPNDTSRNDTPFSDSFPSGTSPSNTPSSDSSSPIIP